MKIYTKTGDDGTTGLFGGGRVAKHHPRVEAYGEVDELNSHVGLARGLLNAALSAESAAALQVLSGRLAEVQSDLFTLGAQLASSREPKLQLTDADVARLEGWIDESEAELAPLANFILPGGSPCAAALHVCRTVCRRAERATWRAIEEVQAEEPDAKSSRQAVPVAPQILVYLNRLSDLLFSWARLANHHLGIADTIWAPRNEAP